MSEGYHTLTADAMTRHRGGKVSISSSNMNPPPLPSRILPDAWAEHGEITSNFRSPEMVHFLADMDGIQGEEDISVDMVTASLEDMMTHFFPY